MWLFLLCLEVMIFSPELGKVIIQTGVGEAEFYLDGTFVAKSNAHGLLTIESFPAGRFGFTVKKNGFITYEGSFAVSEGETKTVAIKLRPIEETGPTSEVQGPRSNPDRVPRSNPAQTRSTSEVKPPAVKSEQNLPDPQQSDTGDSVAGTWLVLGTLILLPVSGSLAWKLYQMKVRGPRSEIRGPELVPETEFMVTGSEEKQKWARTAPAFVEELKRKEDLIKAGFVGTKSNQFDRQAVDEKEKQIVIVLPKEAYHYEDEK
jgi:hypothetical protein